ncbi:MAG TPA: tetratricopeptide repeat protein [Ferruginibacter sp.]|nr:tetratricopeptide repeat protein [Ferruginibacter sp.]
MIRTSLFSFLTFCLVAACTNHTDENTDNNNTFTAAEKTLVDAVSKFPDSLLLREELIQFYRDSADYDKAIAATTAALQRDSLNDRLWNIKANLYFENYDTINAIAALNRAANIYPLPQYIITLGSMYAQKRDSTALQIANFLLKKKITNDDKDAFFIKGLYYNFTGDKIKAIGFFDKCLNLDYNYMFAYREKAIALYDLGKYSDAITVLDKAVTVQTKFDEGYYWLGRCLEKTGKVADAIEAYKTALTISPDYVEAKDALNRLAAK